MIDERMLKGLVPIDLTKDLTLRIRLPCEPRRPDDHPAVVARCGDGFIFRINGKYWMTDANWEHPVEVTDELEFEK